MTGHLACPDTSGPHPAVLLVHEGIGLNDFQRQRADRLAEAGYVAFAMDYLAGRWFADPADMIPVLGPLIADPERMRDIGLAALQVLLDDHQVDPSRVAALGYGTGGSIALELGRDGVPLAAIAVVNPVLPTEHLQRWGNLACPLLMCVGSKDPLAPTTLLNDVTAQLDAAGVDWQLAQWPSTTSCTPNEPGEPAPHTWNRHSRNPHLATVRRWIDHRNAGRPVQSFWRNSRRLAKGSCP